jgi:hypothetical protein
MPLVLALNHFWCDLKPRYLSLQICY